MNKLQTTWGVQMEYPFVSQKRWCQFPYMKNLKRNDTNKLIYKTDSQALKKNLMVAKAEGWGEEIGSSGSICTLCNI